MTDVAVRLDGVTKRYGSVTAIDALTFDVEQGEMFGLIGPDGAGKTTTIRLIGGLLRPDAGRIAVLGAIRRSIIAPSPAPSDICPSASACTAT